MEEDCEGGGDSALKSTTPFKITLGLRLEAKDYNGLWYSAKIMDIDDEKQLAHVHFEGWSSRFDEWISLSSTGSRLRPILRQSQRRDSEKSKRSHSDPRTDFYVGEIVLARWTDCRMYPAKILVANPSSFDVVFYDGFKKTVQHANVKPMTKEMRREFHLPDDGTAGNLCLFGEKKKSGKQAAKGENQITGKQIKVDINFAGYAGKLAKGESQTAVKTEAKLKGEEAQEEERKGKKRKRTMTADTADGGSSTGETESVATGSASATSISSFCSSSSSFFDDKTAVKKGRGRPPIAEKESSVCLAKKLKRDNEEPIASVKEEWRCNVKECAKTFRKESLLVYHLKYYHLDEQSVTVATSTTTPLARYVSATNAKSVPLTLTKSSMTVAKPGPSTVSKTALSSVSKSVSTAKTVSTSLVKSVTTTYQNISTPTKYTSTPSKLSLKCSSSKSISSSAPVKELIPMTEQHAAPCKSSTIVSDKVPAESDEAASYLDSPIVSAPGTEIKAEIISNEEANIAPSATSTPSTPPAPSNRKRKRTVSSTYDDSTFMYSPSTPNRTADDDTTLEFVVPTCSSILSNSSISEDGGMGEDERIRCVCQIYEVTPESGKMLRCKRCRSWQHSSCFILPEDEDEESYLCYICSHPPGIRESKRRLEEMEEYLSSGQLTRFPVPKIKTKPASSATVNPIQPEFKQPLTYGKGETSKSNSADTKSRSLDTLSAVNLRGHDTQAGFFRAVGKVVNNVCAGVHRVNEGLRGAGLKMHRLKQMRRNQTDVDNARKSLMQAPLPSPSSTIDTPDAANEAIGCDQIIHHSAATSIDSSTSSDRLLASESNRIDEEHDALEAQLAAMEAEMDEVERLWDASDEFVSLPPGKKTVAEDSTAGVPTQKVPANGDLENKFRIKRALRGLIDDLNQVQQIAFLQTVKRK